MRRKRVLIVDDEASLTRLLKASLEITGTYEVQEAYSGAEGLAKAESFRPDIILLDIVMPDMSGYDVVSSLRANGRFLHIPIVFLTAIARDSVDKGLASAFDDMPCLIKPMKIEEVIAVIEQQLQKDFRNTFA